MYFYRPIFFYKNTRMYKIQQIIHSLIIERIVESFSSSSSSSSLTTSGFTSVSSLVSFKSFSSFGSVLSSVSSGFSSLSSFLLSSFPRFFGQEFAFDVLEWGLIASGFLLFFSRFSGENDFNDSEVSLLFNFKEAFFSWHENINNFFFVDGSDLMKISDFSLEDFSNPESFFDKSLSCLDSNWLLVFTKEKG